MNERDLFRAVGEAGEDLIEEAERRPRRRAAAYLGALAACAVLALALAQPHWRELPAAEETAPAPAEETAPAEESAAPEGVYIPPMELPEEEAGVAMDMVAFVVYGGRMYCETQTIDCAPGTLEGLLGDYLFTSAGGIDEWSGKGEYVDGRGSVGGDVYTVKGYDSSFRLGIPAEDGGWLQLFDCLNGITLTTGADLYAERLHLAGNWTELEYLTHEDWNENRHAYRAPELTEEQIEDFIAALCAGEFEYWGADGERGDIFRQNLAQEHLYFRMADGTTVGLRLFENGLVMYDGLADRVLVDARGEAFDAVFEACGS